MEKEIHLKTLFLIRHADTRSKGAEKEDIDRSLSARGVKDALWIGKRLKEHGIAVDLILSSSALRARESARLIATELDFPASQVQADRTLYLAGVADILKAVHVLEDAYDTVVFVGHNPGLSRFANWLTNKAVNYLPTSGILCIEFPQTSWRDVMEGSGILSSFEHPTESC